MRSSVQPYTAVNAIDRMSTSSSTRGTNVTPAKPSSRKVMMAMNAPSM